MPDIRQNLSRIHHHWVQKYRLDRHEGVVREVTARSLLVADHYDLFSKLYYAQNRKTRPLQAARVYFECLRALIPEFREPGKEKEKHGMIAFLRAFNNLIDQFREKEFDPELGVIPVGRDGVLLDGTHRVSALSGPDRKVQACFFDDVEPDRFNFRHFRARGMSQDVADRSATMIPRFVPDIQARLFVPSSAAPPAKDGFILFYEREFRVREKVLARLERLAGIPLRSPEAGSGHLLRFQLYRGNGNPLPGTVPARDAVALTDLVLTDAGRRKWLHGPLAFCLLRPLELLIDQLRSDKAALFCLYYSRRARLRREKQYSNPEKRP